MLTGINVGFEDLEAHCEATFCDMNRAAMELNSPLIAKPSVWQDPKDIESVMKDGVIPNLVIDGHKDLLSELSRSASASVQFPINTCYMHGLGCIASAMTKAFTYQYRNKRPPVNLYCVSAQPPSTGKSGINDIFSDPIVEAFNDINSENSSERKQLQREIKKLTKKLESGKDMRDLEEMEMFERLDEAEKRLSELPEWMPIVTDPTIEAAEELAGRQGGMFNIVSAEAEAISVVVGSVYGDDKGGRKANYGLLLKAWDGEYSNSVRITRSGYNGYVRASICVIAQAESVESILAAAASGRGLAERFLLLAEPSLLGKRDHNQRSQISDTLLNKYSNLIKNIVKEKSVCFYFTESSKIMLADWRQKIEPELSDNGKYSHNLLTGFIGKADKQIMKIASVLHCIDHWQDERNRETKITDVYVEKAIYLFEQFALTFISAADTMGYVGESSEIIALGAYLQRRIEKGSNKITYSQLYNGIKNVKPFKGSRGLSKKLTDQLIPTLEEYRYCISDGKTIYINPRLK